MIAHKSTYSTTRMHAAGRDPPYAILLAFSGMRAALAAGSAFNDRVAECHAAAAQLLAYLDRSGEPHLLGQLSHEEYSNHKAVLGADLYLLVCSTNDGAWGPHVGEAQYSAVLHQSLDTPHVASWVVSGRSHAHLQGVSATLQ
jgi:galactokinase